MEDEDTRRETQNLAYPPGKIMLIQNILMKRNKSNFAVKTPNSFQYLPNWNHATVVVQGDTI